MSLTAYKNRRGRAYQCRRCSKIDRRGRMISHILKDHIPLARAPYHCTFCLFRCTDRQSLQNHITRYSRHREKEALMGVPEYKDVLVKASEPYWVGDEDFVQLGQEESACWYARQGKGMADGYCDDSEGLYDEEEEVVITDGRALPRWPVADSNPNVAGAPKSKPIGMAYKSPSNTRLASTFNQSLATQLQGTSYVPAPNGQVLVTNGLPAAARTTYSSLANTVPSGSFTFPPMKTTPTSEGLVPASMGLAFDTFFNTTGYEPCQNAQLPLGSTFRQPLALNQPQYSAQRAQPPMPLNQTRQPPELEQLTPTGNFEFTQRHEVPIVKDTDLDLDSILNTPHLPQSPEKLPQGTPLQDELQLQVTDTCDPLYQEAFGLSEQPLAKKPRIEHEQVERENIRNEKERSCAEREQSTKVKEAGRKEEVKESQPLDGEEKSDENCNTPSALHINFEKKEMTTAEAIIEAAKMICKALDANTRVARCSEKATVKIGGELERIERKLNKIERLMSSKSGEEETTTEEEKDSENKENVEVEPKDSVKRDTKKSTKKEPLKSVVQLLNNRKRQKAIVDSPVIKFSYGIALAFCGSALCQTVERHCADKSLVDVTSPLSARRVIKAPRG